jgi:hypothetical protein
LEPTPTSKTGIDPRIKLEMLVEQLSDVLAPATDLAEAFKIKTRASHEATRADLDFLIQATLTLNGQLMSCAEAIAALKPI